MLFRRKPKPTSSRDGEPLTDYEISLINKMKEGALRCPDCGGRLRGGPCGGCSQNHMCEQCFAEFNLFMFASVAGGERNSTKGVVNEGRRYIFGLR
jgi:hypothetical protein